MATPRKTVYIILHDAKLDELPEVVALVRAGSQAQAIRHVVRGAYSAAPAKIDDVVAFMLANPEAKIEDAGEEPDGTE